MDVKEQVRSSDLGFAIGVGFDTSIGLGIGLRYYSGLSNLDNSELSDLKNQVVTLYFSYDLLK